MRKVILVLCLAFGGCLDADEEAAAQFGRTVSECRRLMAFARTPADSAFLGAWIPASATFRDCQSWLHIASEAPDAR